MNRNRYQLYVSDQSDETAAILVYDGMLNRVLLKWRGEIARRLLDSDILPWRARFNGCRACDKRLIHSLALAATAIGIALDAEEKSDVRLRRTERLNRRLPAFHDRIARLLFAYGGWHFSHEDIICLLTLQNPCVCRRRIESHLNDLVRWKVIQRVEVDQDSVFYDINTEPHLHVYCRRRHELHDAPSDGVLQVNDSKNTRR